MCGIIGYVGNKKANSILLQGLLNLEYRGYDSAGIATLENNNIKILKVKGRVKNLYNLPEITTLQGNLGIAHTRWATHGEPSVKNAHPHSDCKNCFAVVHNGIIENFSELKTFLLNNGFTFVTQTDTEIIPNLIHYYYLKDMTNDKNKVLRAVKNACLDLKGSFALEIITKYEPNNIIVVRKDSPLVIGKGNDENYISSDIPTILSYTKNIYLLNDLEFAVINKNDIKFFDSCLKEIHKDVTSIEWNTCSVDKNGYEDFMLKEIFEQPSSIRETIGTRISENGLCRFDNLNFTYEDLIKINKIYIVACGTASYAGLSGKFSFEKLCNIPTVVEVASEFRYRDPIIDKNTLCIFVSQSGETADTIAALKLSKQKLAKTIAISNVIGSSITREADYSIYTHAGPEIAVASTKAYTAQIILLHMLAIYFAEILHTKETIFLQNLKKDIMNLPNQVDNFLKNSSAIKNYANKIYNEHDIFFIGRGVDYPTAVEGSLKLKEISYIHSEAYPAGELKNGPIALIEKNTTVIGILTDEHLTEKSISNLQEVISRGAKTLIITNTDSNIYNFDMIVQVPKTNVFLTPIVSILPLQLLAYYIAKEKKLDVDKPRNLAKSVTVE